MRLRVAVRLLEIQRVLVRHGLDDFVRATHLYRPFRFLVYLSPWTWFQRSAGATRGERLRLDWDDPGKVVAQAKGTITRMESTAPTPSRRS